MKNLLAAGMSPEMPVVVASNVSRADERRWFGALKDLPLGLDEIGFDNPVLIGVGRVFAEHRQKMPVIHNEEEHDPEGTVIQDQKKSA